MACVGRHCGMFSEVCCRIKTDFPTVGPLLLRGMPSVEIFLRDPSPHIREFRRKPWKTPKGLVDKRDLVLNLAQNRFTTGVKANVVSNVMFIIVCAHFQKIASILRQQ